MEQWKDIIGYEGLYQISNLSNVRSLPKRWETKPGTFCKHNGKILKPGVGGGYKKVVLYKDALPTSFSVHILTAIYWVPNPFNKPVVNHLDGDKLNCLPDNLQWSTHSENSKHAIATGLNVAPMKGKFNELHPNSKIVLQYTKNGVLIKEWPSLKEILRQLKYDCACISRVCLNQRYSAYGFIWKYK